MIGSIYYDGSEPHDLFIGRHFGMVGVEKRLMIGEYIYTTTPLPDRDEFTILHPWVGRDIYLYKQ